MNYGLDGLTAPAAWPDTPVSQMFNGALAGAGSNATLQPQNNGPKPQLTDRPAVQRVLKIIAESPGASIEAMNAAFAMVMDPIQAKVAATQAAKTTTNQGLTDLIAQGVITTPDAAQAYASGMNPSYASKPGFQNTLDSMFSGPGGTSPLTPGGASSDPSVFDNADSPTLVTNAIAPLGALTNTPESLMKVRQAARLFALTNGLDAVGQQKAVDFAEMYWARSVGATPAYAATYGDTATPPTQTPQVQSDLGLLAGTTLGGAAIGSAVPGLGTLIGGGAGLAGGLGIIALKHLGGGEQHIGAEKFHAFVSQLSQREGVSLAEETKALNGLGIYP